MFDGNNIFQFLDFFLVGGGEGQCLVRFGTAAFEADTFQCDYISGGRPSYPLSSNMIVFCGW